MTSIAITLSAILIFLTSVTPSTALAVNETNFEEEYDKLITPLLNSMERGTLEVAPGKSLAYAIAPVASSKKAVVIVPGYSQTYTEYGETLFDLNEKGFSVYIADLRGMGRSFREVKNSQIVHVNQFADYVDDLELFMTEIVLPENHTDLFVIGHSTGGLVASMYMAKSNPFKKAVLISPLFQVHTGSLSEALVLGAVNVGITFGGAKKYAPGQGDFDPSTADPNAAYTTHSQVRRQQQIDMWMAQPELVQGGASNRWVKESILTTRKRKEFAAKIATPILILRSDNDDFVQPKGQDLFCTAAPSCQLETITGAKHELLREADLYRKPVVERIFEFLQ